MAKYLLEFEVRREINLPYRCMTSFNKLVIFLIRNAAYSK